jgi:hypothetical protein
MPYKDPEKRKEYQKKYQLEKQEQIKEKWSIHYEKNKETYKERSKKHYHENKEQNKEKKKEYASKYLEERKQHAINSITAGEIIDRYQWDKWCDGIKRRAKYKQYPYSDDFSNGIMFEMMLKGCFYCGDTATTIDRVDSKLEHTIENCVGCCHGCNISKGAADPNTFIRKAHYRVREKYYDGDIDIWFAHNTKPRMCDYKRGAKKKGVAFELTKEDFDILTKGNCKYCKRRPTTWFGVDRVVPSMGYVLGNVVSCCYDCNLDKSEDDVETMRLRNERIVVRLLADNLVIDNKEKAILHNGTQPSSKKVCVRGQVYDNMSDASRALGMNDAYIRNCIRRGTLPCGVFVINDDLQAYQNPVDY